MAGDRWVRVKRTETLHSGVRPAMEGSTRTDAVIAQWVARRAGRSTVVGSNRLPLPTGDEPHHR
jgi:hypothetical protein